MDILFLIQIITYVIFGTLITYNDIKYAKIYNKHIILLFFLSIAMNFGELFTVDFYLINIISFIVFYLLYKLKLIGAGDSKLLIVSILYFSNLIVELNQ
ncbi:hypothetical protein HN836_01335, partial [Candidatus Woesearchaeota archaeon]|nr:hypothetical protein [Candidatus Woesearchaeota archaeon]